MGGSGRKNIRRQPPTSTAALLIVNICEKNSRQKKKQKKANYDLQHVRTDFLCMMDEEFLDSFMMEIPIVYKPFH